ncbi:DUF6907 domain-containing protein [Streptomyces sp. CAI-85]|uniref:DUF6907 domain-containing protein n=1 Tax=Streptomyces sp. CAI-85 TaxID=1472662 RepID=UPI0015870421|nr:hypothetical protein [Streptomyces sp. CAI-85]NUV60679.1 hypothetical protein [Streptomyces sp. CAI-85]
MSREPRTVTLVTEDHGRITLPEPSWCAGHAGHRPDSARIDVMHVGSAVDLTFLGIEVFTAELVASPYASTTTPRLGGRTPGVSVHPLGMTLDPADLYSLAGALDSYADRLRALADQLTAILTEEHR